MRWKYAAIRRNVEIERKLAKSAIYTAFPWVSEKTSRFISGWITRSKKKKLQTYHHESNPKKWFFEGTTLWPIYISIGRKTFIPDLGMFRPEVVVAPVSAPFCVGIGLEFFLFTQKLIYTGPCIFLLFRLLKKLQ